MNEKAENTVETLLSLAIACEKAVYEFYEGLLRKFAHVPRAVEVWQGMLEDEQMHIRFLEHIRSRLSPDRLRAPADTEMLQSIRKAAKFSPQSTLQKIQNLNDAYEFAHELEHSEVNAVLEFIITEYADPVLKAQMVDQYLRVHLKRLLALGGAEWRRSICAAE